MDSIKFLALSIFVSALMITAALVSRPTVGRYQFQASTPPGVIWTLDTSTGEVTAKNG